MLICAYGFAISLQVGNQLDFVPSVDLIVSYVLRPSKESNWRSKSFKHIPCLEQT